MNSTRPHVSATIRLLALAAVALAACGSPLDRDGRGFARSASSEITVCPSGPVTYGIDVSSYQGTIAWATAADSGVRFAVAKATEGLTVKDQDFANNWSQMKAAGVIRGAYHFFHAQDDGAAQADVFLAMVGTLGESGDLAPMLDWEATDTGISTATAIAQAQKFIDEIKLKTGLDTIIYTYPSFWEELGSPAQFAAHPLWLANYTGPATDGGSALDAGLGCPKQLAPWPGWSFWQWAGDATSTSTPKNPYSGVSGEDLDAFNGTPEELSGWATPPIAQLSGNGALAAVNWPDQHVELFGRSISGDIEELSTSQQGDSWSAAQSLGSGTLCGTSAAFWGAPGLYPELFAPLSNGQTGELLWSGGAWGAESNFGGEAFSNFSAVVGNDGQVRVLALGADQAIWINPWNASAHAFAGWSSLGGNFATGAGAITAGNGTIELFATGIDGSLMECNSSSSSATGFTAWTKLGSNFASRPVPVRWADGSIGHIEAFARGVDSQLYDLEFSSQNGWPQPSVLSAGSEIIGEPSAFMNPNGAVQSGPEVFARDATGRVVHLSRSGSGYTNFAPLGDQVAASDPFAWIRGDGAAEVFAVDMSGNLVRTRRDASGNWGSWSAIASGFDPCAPALVGEMDGGVDDGGSDAGGEDAGSEDAGSDGGEPRDAGSGDAGVNDGGAHDGGITDAGHSDAGLDGGSSGADGGILVSENSGCAGEPSGPFALLAIGFSLFIQRRRRQGASASFTKRTLVCRK